MKSLLHAIDIFDNAFMLGPIFMPHGCLARHDGFNITEKAEESDISRQAAIPVVKKFLQWNLLKIDSKRGNANYYKVNEDSNFIKAFREINNSIIARKLGEEELLSRQVQPIPACNNPTPAPLGMPLPS
jgi:hypothetical protein